MYVVFPCPEHQYSWVEAKDPLPVLMLWTDPFAAESIALLLLHTYTHTHPSLFSNSACLSTIFHSMFLLLSASLALCVLALLSCCLIVEIIPSSYRRLHVDSCPLWNHFPLRQKGYCFHMNTKTDQRENERLSHFAAVVLTVCASKLHERKDESLCVVDGEIVLLM